MEAKSTRRAGRPRTFNREKVLDRAMHVFWEKGYEGASMHDLTTAMGIQPASLYAAFGNKQAMFERTLDQYLAGPAAFMSAALEEPTAYAVSNTILPQPPTALTPPHPRSGSIPIQ